MSFCLIDSARFKHNIEVVSNNIDFHKIAIVIKNNAYGHGLLEIAKLASINGIRHAVVINCNEANLVKDFFDTVLVLSDTVNEFDSSNIHIAINDLDSISSIPKHSKVELKIDTGMHRNGIHITEINQALDMIDSRQHLLKGVFTHFADPYNRTSMLRQKEKFDKLKDEINTIYPGKCIRFHCSSSPSIFLINNEGYDLARIGIALYGYVELPKKHQSPNLKPIMSLWAEKVSSRKISKGDRVGYGGVFHSKEDMIISTYDIGYGDGFMRLDEHKTSKISDGRDVIGRVSMNNLAIAGNDQEVCIFDNVKDLSKVHNTISYEILCRINENIEKRII
tara:strand:+ start:2677 stop:3684 length:1008 start_codon:yes stop_codon:yes gene_type:complete